MTLKKPMRRFVHYRRHGDGGGYDYFECVDESFVKRVRSMVVDLMVNNERMATKIPKLENDLESQKYELNKIKDKNGRRKLRLCAYHRRQKRYMYCVIVLILIVGMYICHV